jgi:predicted SnoaL-like aldol condensation-catalyzing enzyme
MRIPRNDSHDEADAGMMMRSEQSNVGRYYASMEAALREPSPYRDEELFAPDCVEHGVDGDRSGTEVVAWLAARRRRYPDAVWTIEVLTSVGDMVICHATMLASLVSGGETRVMETVAARFVDGRIAECWRSVDEYRLPPRE